MAHGKGGVDAPITPPVYGPAEGSTACEQAHAVMGSHIRAVSEK